MKFIFFNISTFLWIFSGVFCIMHCSFERNSLSRCSVFKVLINNDVYQQTRLTFVQKYIVQATVCHAVISAIIHLSHVQRTGQMPLQNDFGLRYRQ